MSKEVKLRYPKDVTLFDMINEWPAEQFEQWCREAHDEYEENPDWWKSEEAQKDADEDLLNLKKYNWEMALYNLMGEVNELSSENMHELVCMANQMPVKPMEAMRHRPENYAVQSALGKLIRSGHVIKCGSELSKATGRRVALYSRADSPPRYFNPWVNRAIKGSAVEFLPEEIAKLSSHYGDHYLNLNHGFAGSIANLMKDGERRTVGEAYKILAEANGLKVDPASSIQTRPLYINVKGAFVKLVNDCMIANIGKVGKADAFRENGDLREAKLSASQYQWIKGAKYTDERGHGTHHGSNGRNGTNAGDGSDGHSKEAIADDTSIVKV